MRRRRRQPRQLPWDEDPRNPDMKVMRTFVDDYGRICRVLVTPEESQRLCDQAMQNPYLPSWDKDPTYF